MFADAIIIALLLWNCGHKSHSRDIVFTDLMVGGRSKFFSILFWSRSSGKVVPPSAGPDVRIQKGQYWLRHRFVRKILLASLALSDRLVHLNDL